MTKLLTPQRIREHMELGRERRVADDGWAEISVQAFEPNKTRPDYFAYFCRLQINVRNIMDVNMLGAPGVEDALLKNAAHSINQELYGNLSQRLAQLSHQVDVNQLSREQTAAALRHLSRAIVDGEGDIPNE